MRNFDEILAKIARDNGTTPEDVLHEMQVAIDNAYDHHDQEAQQLWDKMTFKGDIEIHHLTRERNILRNST